MKERGREDITRSDGFLLTLSTAYRHTTFVVVGDYPPSAQKVIE